MSYHHKPATAWWLLSLMGWLLLAGCSGDPQEEAVLPAGRRVLLSIAVPAGSLAVTRAEGDPGTQEVLAAPTKAWLYFVNQNGVVAKVLNDENKVIENPIALPTPEAMVYKGRLASDEDVVLHYGINEIRLPSGSTSGSFYLVMADTDLRSGDKKLEELTPATLEDVLNLSFDAEGEVRNHLQNIYTTPYNYLLADGHYYGELRGEDEMVELMPYHLASRVDLMWNVVGEEAQDQMRITFIEARKLMEYDCLLFRPTENVRTNKNGYDLTLVKDDVARQWYGRHTFYTIPFRSSKVDGDEEGDGLYHLHLRMWKNGQDKDSKGETNANTGYQTDLRMPMGAANAVFVPWLRVNLKYTEPFEYNNTEEVNVLTQQNNDY